MEHYFKANKSLWNDKTDVHVESDFYNLNDFRKGKLSLNNLEMEALGDVNGKSLLHLQCHFGMDSLSWSKLGAKVTGVDISEKAIAKAKELNQELNLDAEFICSNIYDLKENLHKKFDIIFMSYGVIGWLPDLDKWAEIVLSYLNDGGVFYIIEFHPVLWMFDNSFSKIEYSYFNDGPIHEEIKGTYAQTDAPISGESFTWNHPLAELMNPLIKNGLTITEFNEYPFCYYNCFENMIMGDDGYYRIKNLSNKIPMMFSIKAIK